ncbi:hypothetical protein SDJN02_04439, partial [Cucurbita argyrosperma subsp. argyrosperma]
MKFIMEFAENLVLRLMEDPKERDRKFREHVYAVKDRCQKTKEMWSYPIRPYGFWTFERHNCQLRMFGRALKSVVVSGKLPSNCLNVYFVVV